jgi:hypothetical protein
MGNLWSSHDSTICALLKEKNLLSVSVEIAVKQRKPINLCFKWKEKFQPVHEREFYELTDGQGMARSFEGTLGVYTCEVDLPRHWNPDIFLKLVRLPYLQLTKVFVRMQYLPHSEVVDQLLTLVTNSNDTLPHLDSTRAALMNLPCECDYLVSDEEGSATFQSSGTVNSLKQLVTIYHILESYISMNRKVIKFSAT